MMTKNKDKNAQVLPEMKLAVERTQKMKLGCVWMLFYLCPSIPNESMHWPSRKLETRHRAGGKRQYGLALLRICYRIVLILKVELRRATTSRRMKESPNTYKSRSVNTGRSAEMRYDI